MAEEKFGIENLQKLLELGITVGKQASVALEDGKVTFSEGIALALALSPIGDLVAKKDDIINEAKDLSTEEIEKLVAQVQGGITNDKVVATIGYGLNIYIAVMGLVDLYK